MKVVYPDKVSWLSGRRIGASDASIICHEAPPSWPSEYMLYSVKRGLVEDSVEGEWLEWGVADEPGIEARYVRETKRLTEDPGQFTLYVHDNHSFMTATPDRFVYDESRDEVGVLELKTCAHWHKSDWDMGVPIHYQIQVQHQMACTNTTWGAIACRIFPWGFACCDIERDDDFIQRLIQAESEFWEGVLKGEPPPVDGTDSTKRALQALYPSDDGETVPLPFDFAALDDEREKLMAEMKVLEKRKAEIDNAIKAAIGGAKYGVLPDCRYNYFTTERKGCLQVSWDHFEKMMETGIPFDEQKPSTSRSLRRAEVKHK